VLISLGAVWGSRSGGVSGDELEGVEVDNETAHLSPGPVSAARVESAEDTGSKSGESRLVRKPQAVKAGVVPSVGSRTTSINRKFILAKQRMELPKLHRRRSSTRMQAPFKVRPRAFVAF
jgi:hypothetical protein